MERLAIGNMKPYSIDFREKVIKAYERGDTSIRKLAARKDVSKAFVQRLLKQKKLTECDLDMIYYREIGKPYWLSLFQNWVQRVGVKTKVLKLSTTAAPVSFHLIPEQHKRCLMTVLQAASVTPDPIG